jgi:signal transduction histidine kinase
MASPAARRLLIPDDGFFPSSVRDDVVLLVTELLTNAVRHANGEPMRVELRRWADFVRVEVFGEGAGFLRRRARSRPCRSDRGSLGDHANCVRDLRVV